MQPVHFISEASIRAKAQEAFEHHHAAIARLLPTAVIEHIGSTAVPGSLTKGDLDLLVSVPPADFPAADAVLARHYQRNMDSTHDGVFASFKDDRADPPLGIQLTCDEKVRDEFLLFRQALLRDPSLVSAYNGLKRECDGLPMETYRKQKDTFIRRMLDDQA
jgi:GrpB-like predicted nucleotidyltransferase (UPF0157 family)